MKKIQYCSIVILAFIFVLPPFCALGAAGKIQFGETLTDKLELVRPGDKFPGPYVSWLATSPDSFGKPKIVISLYKDKEAAQSLLDRREIDVNPAWNNIGLTNMRIDKAGTYTIVLSHIGGEEIASGTVTILDPVDDVPAKPEKKIGGTLEELFNKYNPKQ